MKEFVMIFRNEARTDLTASPDQMQQIMKSWMDWMGNIAAQNKLASSGNRLGIEGKTVRSNHVVTDGPYVEIKEAVGGYIIVRADSLSDAAELAKDCPIFAAGGNVEIRNVIDMQS